MEKNFVKVQSTKDITIGASLIIAGIVMAIAPIGGAMNVTGILTAVTGLVLLFILKNGYKDSNTGERYIKKEYFYPANMKTQLIAALTANPDTILPNNGENGNAIRLEIFYNKTLDKAYLQLFEYIPYKYEPCSDVVVLNTTGIQNLVK